MKKLLSITLILFALATQQANAQLGDILGKVASAVGSGSGSNITQIITSQLVPSSKQIIGTWAYQEPAVMFTSDNALKKVAGSVASSTVEKKLQTYLNKVGIKKGNLTITFKEDETFSINKGTKTIRTGTYSMNGNDVTLTFKGKTKPCKLTPQLDNGTLVVVMDATALKNFMSGIASYVSSLSTVTSLLNAYDGM